MSNLKQCPKCLEMVDARGYSMHYAYCKGDKEDVSRETQSKEIDKEISTKKCHNCNSENIKRLDEYVIESGKKFDTKSLYSKGYTHVCCNCGEVLK